MTSVKTPSTATIVAIKSVRICRWWRSLVRVKQLKPKPESADPEVQIKEMSRRLSQAKLWESDPKRWEEVQEYLGEIPALLIEVEED